MMTIDRTAIPGFWSEKPRESDKLRSENTQNHKNPKNDLKLTRPLKQQKSQTNLKNNGKEMP